jgi:hypothetical protein
MISATKGSAPSLTGGCKASAVLPIARTFCTGALLVFVSQPEEHLIMAGSMNRKTESGILTVQVGGKTV